MIDDLLKHPIVPVVEIDSANHAEPLAEALLAGGVSIIEVTLRTDAAIETIARIRRALPEVLVGAGTVLGDEDAMRTLDAGAQFGVSPGFNPELIGLFHTAGVPFVPGVLTPTEIDAALRTKCTLLKFFPAEAAGGARYLEAISGPFAARGVRFCATGGISADSMRDYFAVPTVCAVGGSWLASRKAIAAGQWSSITREAIATRRKLEQLGVAPGPRAQGTD